MTEKYMCISIKLAVTYDDSEKTEEEAVNDFLADYDLGEQSYDTVEVFESGDVAEKEGSSYE